MTSSSEYADWSPDDWLASLKDGLRVAGEGYRRCIGNNDDPEELSNHPGIRANSTSFAMLTVGVVMDRLSELPGMREHVGLVPLHDLVAALWGLGRGEQPVLLQPVPGVGKGAEQVASRWVRQHALLFVALLEGAGMKGRPACRLVAKILADHGHSGRKRRDGPQPLSEGTVVDWRNRSRQRDFDVRDPSVARFLDRNLSRFRNTKGWPYSEADAVNLVTRMAKSELLRSKSG